MDGLKRVAAQETAGPERGEARDGAGPAQALPADAPLEMPAQDFYSMPQRAPRPASAPLGTGLRRALVFGGAAGLTAIAAHEMYLVLNVAGFTPIEIVFYGLFVVSFAWIALAFVTAFTGFVQIVRGGERRLGIDARRPLPRPKARTAVLLPTYNEDPARVFAALRAMQEALAGTGRGEAFDFFVLSDTTDPDIWLAEEAAFVAARRHADGLPALYYRRRVKNIDRKAGNIGEWCRRWGGAYEHMLVLDADSVMTADAMIRLSAAMEAHPDTGLIQTLPLVVNRNTAFARVQQFASRVYGRVIAAGLAWWHGAEGNFWGHNAIIRTKAFAQAAGLPHLKGKPPFGGHILSHDFVEAALLRRAGWAVHMVPDLPGSYEESPPSLADLATRDRRWCQGNLQHSFVLPARGLHWVSRSHFLVGILSYLASPAWLLFLLVGMFAALQATFIRPEYFPADFVLFPQWPQQDPVRAAWLFGASMAVLLAPKLFGFLALMADPEARKACGGAIRVFFGMIVETLISGLLAPVMMLIQSRALAEIVTGRDAGWQAQRRDDGTIPFGDVVRAHAGHTLLGLALGAGAYAVAPSLLLWMSPVVAGLVLAVPLAAWTASLRTGLALKRLGLLTIPEETRPPHELSEANALTEAARAEQAENEGVRRLVADPALMAAHIAMLPPPAPRRRGEIDLELVAGLAKLDEARSIDEALADLTRREKAAVLADRRGVERLAELTRPAAAES